MRTVFFRMHIGIFWMKIIKMGNKTNRENIFSRYCKRGGLYLMNYVECKMKIIITILAIVFISVTCLAQDGSDMRYIPIKKIDKSFIGKFAHLDFYNNSYYGAKLDTVLIIVDSKPIRFIEHRVDDGLNQWFSQQYLFSLDSLN